MGEARPKSGRSDAERRRAPTLGRLNEVGLADGGHREGAMIRTAILLVPAMLLAAVGNVQGAEVDHVGATQGAVPWMLGMLLPPILGIALSLFVRRITSRPLVRLAVWFVASAVMPVLLYLGLLLLAIVLASSGYRCGGWMDSPSAPCAFDRFASEQMFWLMLVMMVPCLVNAVVCAIIAAIPRRGGKG